MTSDLLSNDELEKLDFFEDLKERFIHVEGINIRWRKKDVEGLGLEQEDYLALYRYMLQHRCVEEAISTVFRQGLIPGSIFLSTGNEATAVGSGYSLRPEDNLLPLHREVGVRLMRGTTPKTILANHMGRVDGPTRGRDGNYHYGDAERNTFGMISHLGTMLPIACGAVWADRYHDERTVALTYIGDGSTSTGDFHGGINFAAVHKLPVIVVLVNNQWAYGTPLEMQFSCKFLALKAVGYGIEGYFVDGTDVLAVHQVCKEAIERARDGEGPFLVECLTMRMRGHSEYDRFEEYVPKEQLEKWATRDPILTFEKFLKAKKIVSPKKIASIQKEVQAEIDQAVEEAKASPLPDATEAGEDVFAP